MCLIWGDIDVFFQVNGKENAYVMLVIRTAALYAG
jgi:hypothetical protein